MEFLNFVMALSPIIVVLVGILGFRQSAKKVAPVALIWTLVLAFTYFNITGASLGNLLSAPITPWPPAPPWTRPAAKIRS